MRSKYLRYYSLYKHFSNWSTYLGVKSGWMSQDPIRFETRTGLRVDVPRSLLREFKEIFFEENYLQPLKLRPETVCTVIDIGANVGFFSMFAAHVFPQASIFAYEPIPSNFERLSRHSQQNPGSRVSCFQKAVGGKVGELDLHWQGTGDLTTSASVFGSGSGRHLKVPCTTLAQIFRDEGLSHIDLLKMDCEGAEYEILYEAPPEILKKVNHISMEVHRGSQPTHQLRPLIEFLQSQGFSVQHRGTDRLALLWASQ